MKIFSKMSKFLAVGSLVVLAGAAQATPINVGGVVWDPDSGADFQSNGNVYETFAGAVGDTVTGFGTVTQYNGTTVGDFCPGCELTFTFSMDLVSAIPGAGGSFNFSFDNIAVNMYVDDSPEYNQLSPSFADASDGVLFLSAVNNGLLSGFANNLFDPANILGFGGGFLDVTGGLAEGNFDTNTRLNGSDLAFTSSFQPANLNVPGFPLFGSVDLSGDTIPEPGSVLLLGGGLLGLYMGRRRRTKKA